MAKLLVFAGTTEGRELLETLSSAMDGSGLSVFACVATDYGRNILAEGLENIQIRSGRLSSEEMAELMTAEKFDYVIDTTHPYATAASENIKAACAQSGCQYLRVLRSGAAAGSSDCLFFRTNEEAADYLDKTEGNILLTVGSKELAKYIVIENYQKRIFTRILPMTEALENCSDLGFPGRQIICMQGPFTAELNIALIRQIGARFMVTKDSGAAGGFFEKYSAAKETGTVLVVIGREKEAEGISLPELLEFLKETFSLNYSQKTNLADENLECPGDQETNLEPIEVGTDYEGDRGSWFPFFTNISGKTFLVAGGGKIATRRIETLMRFDCRIKVVAKEASAEVSSCAGNKLELHIKAFEPFDLDGADYVLAATDDSQLNHDIYKLCKAANIPVNVADNKEKSDFYFPGIVRKHGVTVGITAEGKDHKLAKTATKAIAGCLNESLQEG